MVSKNLFCIVLLVMDLQFTKNTKNQESNNFKKVIESVLWHITFSLENDDHKNVDFNGDKITFT